MGSLLKTSQGSPIPGETAWGEEEAEPGLPHKQPHLFYWDSRLAFPVNECPHGGHLQCFQCCCWITNETQDRENSGGVLLFSSFGSEKNGCFSVVSRVVKKSACNVGDPGSIPGSGRSSGVGNGNPLQYPCLENYVDRGTWRVTVCGVAELATNERVIFSLKFSLCLGYQETQNHVGSV